MLKYIQIKTPADSVRPSSPALPLSASISSIAPVIYSLLLLLSACESTNPNGSPNPQLRQIETVQKAPIKSVSEALRQANISMEPVASQLRAKAARLALDNGDLEQAERISAVVLASALKGQPLIDYLLTQGQILLYNGKPDEALKLLEQNSLNGMAPDIADQIKISYLKADAYAAGQRLVTSARERVLIDHLLSKDQSQINREKIFNTLLELPAPLLVTYAKKAVSNELRGWLSLAAMTKQFQNKPSQQLKALRDWRKLWAGHPAAQTMPESLELLDTIVAGQPDEIAILLPQSGRLSTIGQAIQNGILAAHFEQESTSRIRIYDTARGEPIQALISRAAEEGADLIIGPLDKEKVAVLSKLRLPIPVLALNRLNEADFSATNPNLYHLSLAPEDEASQIARQARREGLSHALVIAPNNEWGDRAAQAFKQTWSKFNGLIADEARFIEDENYNKFIQELLLVNKSVSRAAELKRIIGSNFEFTPQRRQDIDVVVLLANSTQARQINPSLAFFYADDLPVYGTSLTYQTGENRINNIDLNGIRFCDIPWKLAPADEFQKRIHALWPESAAQLASIFALGIDAYNVLPRLKQLRDLPDSAFFGGTGKLTMKSQNLVRELMWGQFNNGKVSALPIITEPI
ncbi:MAG: penicillin-binding protein activator [Gammaproteobacteria bacterium]|nr:penicillin-binding protein activator [Gammaproteobacteria bacterium]